MSNKIMRIYKDLDMVEQLGSGMNRILSFYKKDIFLFYDDFLRMVFVSNYDEIKDVGANVRVNEWYEFIKIHEPVRTNIIAEYFNKVTQRTIERWIKQLRDEAKIEFVGSSKVGGYYVK